MRKMALIFLLLAAGMMFGEGQFTPNEVELLRIKLAQKDAIIAEQHLRLLEMQCEQLFSEQFRTARADQERTQKALLDEVDMVKKNHGWGQEVRFDPQTLTFSPIGSPGKKDSGAVK
jgi:hypothetical protein